MQTCINPGMRFLPLLESQREHCRDGICSGDWARQPGNAVVGVCTSAGIVEHPGTWRPSVSFPELSPDRIAMLGVAQENVAKGI